MELTPKQTGQTVTRALDRVMKTPEQRQAELKDWLVPAERLAKEIPQEPSVELLKLIRNLEDLPISLGNVAVTKIPNWDKWNSYVSQKGANKGNTIHSAFGYRQGNFAIGKPVEGYQMFVSISVAFVPSTK